MVRKTTVKQHPRKTKRSKTIDKQHPRKCPGSKIRSKGLGRGLGRGFDPKFGKGRGPIGIPVGAKEFDPGFGRGMGRGLGPGLGRGRRLRFRRGQAVCPFIQEKNFGNGPKTEKVRYLLPSGRGIKEVTYKIEEKGLLEGMRTPIKARIIKK